MTELFELGLFYQALTRGKENVFTRFFQIAYGEHRADRFSRLQSDQIAYVFAFAGSTDIGDLIHLQPVHASGVGEDENEGVRRSDKQMLDEIFVARLHAGPAGAAATLHSVRADRCALHVPAVADCDSDLLVHD